MSIQLFDNGEFQLRVTPVGDTFKVEAPGLARALGFREAYDLVQSIPDEEKGSGPTRTPGGDQQVWHVTEPGFYRAIGQRQAARVKSGAVRDQVIRFQNWVYREVLPAIRRTGSYGTPAVPDMTTAAGRMQILTMAMAAEQRALAAEERAAELEAPAEAWNTLASADPDFSAREAAYILNRDPSISTGQNRLLNEMRRMRVIDSRDIPYATHERHVRLRPRTYTNRATGEEHAAKSQVRITAEGLSYLHKRLGGTKPLQLGEEVDA